MSHATISRVFGLDGRAVIDGWLCFASALRGRYEADHGRERAFELRTAIVVGLLFYNVYSVTALLLMPDIALIGIGLRLGVFTPLMAGLAWLVVHTPARWNERMIFVGMLGAQGLPVWQFWLTRDPMGLLTFGELFLCIVYANMLLALRFPYAVAFTAYALAVTLIALFTKPDLGPVVVIAFSLQITTACAFALFANYRLERRRCDDYVAALGATLEAQEAETARRTFQDLSRTDVLTGLPNRRHLTETIDLWWTAPDDLALVMIDIDHFKSYNDRLGHPAGDECLRRVAELLSATIPGGDGFCARFGGEEFTVLVRVRSADEAAAWARCVVQAIRSAALPHPARPDGLDVVTASAGAAVRHSLRAASPAELFSLADAALYAAKTRGRNGFVMNAGPVELSRTG